MEDKSNHEGSPNPEVAKVTSQETGEALDLDELQLRAQGHVGQLPRRFSTFSMLGLSFSITNTWIAYAATFTMSAWAGSGPGVFWALIVACVACSIINTGLAELASAFPSAGGQYHYAFMVAPEQWRPAVAFTTGWLSIFGWVFTTASTNIFVAQATANLASFVYPSYEVQAWQIWLIYTLSVILSSLVVIFAARFIPKTTASFFLASLLGVVVALIAMLATSDTKASGEFVFVQWVNQTGWPDGLAFLIGVGQAMYGFACIDSATHLAEELPAPGRHVPRVMIMTPIIGILTTLPYTLSFLFSSTDLDAALNSSLPLLEIYFQAVSNKGGAVFLAAWIVFLYWGAAIGLTVTSGRLIWAFARDNGLPYSKIFARTHPTLEAPVNATLLCVIFVILYGLIYIGSSEAYNSFISTAILSLNLSYAAPQAVLLLRGRERSRVLPRRYLDLGAVIGPFFNAWAVGWVLLYIVIFCFPYFNEVTAESMNYVSVVISAMFVFIAVMWWLAGKRRTFVGPKVEADSLQVLSMVH